MVGREFERPHRTTDHLGAVRMSVQQPFSPTFTGQPNRKKNQELATARITDHPSPPACRVGVQSLTRVVTCMRGFSQPSTFIEPPELTVVLVVSFQLPREKAWGRGVAVWERCRWARGPYFRPGTWWRYVMVARRVP